ncbi:urease accessory protein UreF [Picosynechococcus sp. PCC 11901]|uniref:urease accessory protein UreF n=1 Tax=Picosynechococcus sp. PCC 11901 TaxID=2579791 RepID=UPI0028F41C81|nr:urease accessory protein UreF [Picosynechococcus sp. PCC 11901]
MVQQLILWQLINSNFPLGAYNYSEGLEYLVESAGCSEIGSFQDWLGLHLRYGSIRAEVSVVLRIVQAIAADDLTQLQYWNSWLNGTRETKELRQQSIQMGNSLLKLLGDLDENKRPQLGACREQIGKSCHYAIAFGIAVALWDIEPHQAVLGYLHSWLSNLVSAGVKLIPLGQTQGQRIIYQLQPLITEIAETLVTQKEMDLYACTWGLSLASMNHETQYTRLFRS